MIIPGNRGSLVSDLRSVLCSSSSGSGSGGTTTTTIATKKVIEDY